jgi:hypothetical protein
MKMSYKSLNISYVEKHVNTIWQCSLPKLSNPGGSSIAQAVCRRLPTSAARVRDQVRSCGICGGQSGTGASFPSVLRFSLPILIPLTAPHSSSIVRGWYNRSFGGRRTKWTQSHPTQENKTKKYPGNRNVWKKYCESTYVSRQIRNKRTSILFA